jgi:hypothetical protein
LLFIDWMDARDAKASYEGNQSIKVGCADEVEQVSKDWPHTLTSGAGHRALAHIAPEAAGN